MLVMEAGLRTTTKKCLIFFCKGNIFVQVFFQHMAKWTRPDTSLASVSSLGQKGSVQTVKRLEK